MTDDQLDEQLTPEEAARRKRQRDLEAQKAGATNPLESALKWGMNLFRSPEASAAPAEVEQPTPAASPAVDQARARPMEKLSQAKDKIDKMVESGSGDKPLSAAEATQTMGYLDQLVKDAKARGQEEEFPATQANEALQKAAELYRQKANRNEWYEVAQTLANAVAQYGAARSGMHSGRDTRIQPGPGIDYGRKTDQAYRDYQMEKGLIEDKYGRSEASRREVQRLQEKQQEQAAEDKRFGLREKAQREAESRANQRLSDSDRKESLKQAQSQLPRVKEEQQALDKLDAALSSEKYDDDTIEKLQEKHPDYFAKAGVSPEDLKALREEGRFFGTNESPDLRKKLIDAKRRTLADSIQELKGQIDSLSVSRRGQGAPQAPARSPQQGPATVQIQAPDGSIAEVPADKAQKYLDKGGKIVGK